MSRQRHTRMSEIPCPDRTLKEPDEFHGVATKAGKKPLELYGAGAGIVVSEEDANRPARPDRGRPSSTTTVGRRRVGARFRFGGHRRHQSHATPKPSRQIRKKRAET